MRRKDAPAVPMGGVRQVTALGDGGQGRVYTVLDSPHLVYKEYKRPDDTDADALRALVAAPSMGPRYHWAFVLERSAWVSRTVEDAQGQVTGLLMPRVPEAFSMTLSGVHRLREFQFLMFEPRAAWEGVALPTVTQLVALAQDAATLLAHLHRLNLVVGDISMNNILWALDPRPRVMLLDCDGIRQVGSAAAVAQLDTPDWNDPEAPATTATKDSDRYKLALLLGRVLARDAYVRPGTPLQVRPDVDERVRLAAARVFDSAAGPRGTRPNAEQWVWALQGGQVSFAGGRP